MRASSLRKVLAGGSLVAALTFSAAANASLVLNQNVTNFFQGHTSSTGTSGNDLPGKPSTLYLGQLKATETGVVDFFYIGNEAAYANTIHVGSSTYSTAGLPDNFNSRSLIGSVGVGTNEFVDFGFCTTGGNSVGAYGRCAENDSAASLIAQFNYQNAKGYRSIAFRPLSSFNEITGARTYASLAGGAKDLWAVFWDDSGAQNDDDHDDLIAIAKWRPVPVEVPEPATAAVLGMGLLALGLRRKRKV
jgi:hypothetical protein